MLKECFVDEGNQMSHGDGAFSTLNGVSGFSALDFTMTMSGFGLSPDPFFAFSMAFTVFIPYSIKKCAKVKA